MRDFGRSRASTERFRGLRCIHTHLQDEKLTQDDLTDLALLRLDLMSIIQVDRETGLPGLIFSAHLLPAGNNDSRVQTGDQNSSRSKGGTPAPFADDAVTNRSLPAASISTDDEHPYEFLEPEIPAHLDTDFLDLISSLEAEMARVRRTA